MKILWIPQISSKSISGELLIEKDSNWAFFANLLTSPFGENNNITVLLEYEIGEAMATKLLGRYSKIDLKIIQMPRKYTTAQHERICFMADIYAELLRQQCYDVIFLNEPCKATNLRVILGKNCQTKIVSYIHWLAMDNLQQQQLTQFEGLLNSDLCLVNSAYVTNRIKTFADSIELPFVCKVTNLPPSYDLLYEQPIKNINKITGIIYNHRISTDRYYATAYNSLLKILDMVHSIAGEENMPTVYLTNPSGKYIKQDRDYFKIIELSTQQDYFDFLKSDNVQVHLNTFFESKGMWSMSTVEAAITGNVCLLPNKYGYAEIFDKNVQEYCKDWQEAACKLISLILNPRSYIMYTRDGIHRHNNIAAGVRLNSLLAGLVNEKEL